MLKKNELYRAAVTGFTSDGLGVCRVEGCAVFVPNAAPDEEYDLRITHVGKNSAHGKIVNIITKSAAAQKKPEKKGKKVSFKTY